ncbi:hypothetical protein C8Q77DRAFT_1016755, partial [Trametes polyzona]
MPRTIARHHLDSMFQFKAITTKSYDINDHDLGLGDLIIQPSPSIALDIAYVFKALSAPRKQTSSAIPAKNHETNCNGLCSVNSNIDASNMHTAIADRELRLTIMQEWRASVSAVALLEQVCAVCARRTNKEYILKEKPDNIRFDLLQNENLPLEALPDSYNFEAYQRAILNPKGLLSPQQRSDILICKECHSALQNNQLPRYALANWLYYGHDKLPHCVQSAFSESTQFERLLISRARASVISVRFSDIKGHYENKIGQSRDGSQGCVRGNVAIHPQDAAHLTNVLPPGHDAIRDSICAVFVGENPPSPQNIEALKPVIVRKSRVKTLIEFLVSHNTSYCPDGTFVGFSKNNLNNLFGEGTASTDCGIPCAMEIGHIQLNDAINAATEGYVPDGDESPLDVNEDILLENVGYIDGSNSPVSLKEMSVKAISHCLSGRRFIQSQAGSDLVPDFDNEHLLTWLYPHLDPWGIGGFNCKQRSVYISMEQQLKYLMQVDAPVFRHDPDFAFVFYNILQKRSVLRSVSFTVSASKRESVIQELLTLDVDAVTKLAQCLEKNPQYKAENAQEKEILRLLLKVNTICHDLPGSNGYKIKLRNEIRALVNHLGTPTLFVTLNPEDRDNPLVCLYAGNEVEYERQMKGEELDRWRRRVFAGKEPAACARFFDKMITNFINIVLRFGRPGRGLFG